MRLRGIKLRPRCPRERLYLISWRKFGAEIEGVVAKIKITVK